jgi:hypothetical protein
MAKHNVQEHTLQAILWAVAQPWKVTAAYQPALQAKQKASGRSHQKGGGLAGQRPASHEHATQPAYIRRCALALKGRGALEEKFTSRPQRKRKTIVEIKRTNNRCRQTVLAVVRRINRRAHGEL